MSKLPQCSKCNAKPDQRACRVEGGVGPDSCPTNHMQEVMELARQRYAEPEVHEFARQSSIQEAEGYGGREKQPYVRHPVKTRIEEICEFAHKMNYKRLGLAFCAGLHSEASRFTKVLELHGFEVVSVICKVGCTPKEEIGVTDSEKVRIGQYESMCSPIAQAEVLNEAGTDFNIVLGLCVGHDSLFFKNAKSMSTVFAVKDRVLGHNPLAAIYTLNSYSERLVKGKE